MWSTIKKKYSYSASAVKIFLSKLIYFEFCSQMESRKDVIETECYFMLW
jgi:hypothetical protein